MRRGSQPDTSAYTRKSNLSPLYSRGLDTYFWTTQCSYSMISACNMRIVTINILGYKYTPSLTACLRLHDKRFQNTFTLCLLIIISKSRVIVGQQKGSGEKIILLWVVIIHAIQIFC